MCLEVQSRDTNLFIYVCGYGGTRIHNQSFPDLYYLICCFTKSSMIVQFVWVTQQRIAFSSPAYMQTADRWASTTQTSSVFPDHSVLLKTILYWIKKHKVKDICLEFWEYFSHVFKRYKCPCCQRQCVWVRFCNSFFTNVFYKHYTFCFSELIHKFISTVFWLKP